MIELKDNVDEILRFFVIEADERGLALPLTLCVKGVVLAGDLISSETYGNKMIELLNVFEKDFDSNIPEDRIKKYKDIFFEYSDLMKKPNNEAKSNPKYIHLENIAIRNGQGPKLTVSNLWRGKISAIDGFFIGKNVTVREELVDNQP